MRFTKIKIKRQKSWDRNVIEFYNGNEMVGLNFYQGVTEEDDIDTHWLKPCEQLFMIYKNYQSRYREDWPVKKMINKAIEAYLFANNKMY